MIIFENHEEYKAFIKEVSKTLKSQKPPEIEFEDDISEDDQVGGEVPLDKVFPPSKGHSVGRGVPNTSSKNQPYYGGPWLEHSLENRLENRLESLLEDLGNNDQTDNAQQSAQTGAVGMTGLEGHGTGKDDDPRTPLLDKYAAGKKAHRGKNSKEAEEEGSEEMKSTMQSLGIDPNEASSSV